MFQVPIAVDSEVMVVVQGPPPAGIWISHNGAAVNVPWENSWNGQIATVFADGAGEGWWCKERFQTFMTSLQKF